ncbi:MAG TPA: ATP-binding protein [Solirubrobacteraceae bacterium]|jgi:two-component system sensor histidine kinase SenX3|nr:ATP-binding protein [Solirubrobacteraceae bacterium]
MPDLSFRRRDGFAASDTHSVPTPAELALDALETLAAAVLVTGPDRTIFFSNPAARRLGLGGRGTTLPPMLSALAAAARAGDEAIVRQLTLPAATDIPLRLRHSERAGPSVRARAHALGGDGSVVIVLEDLTEALRVEAVRRDFVANVSHELKTPVGAMQLLAEALHDASDDPTAVRHFAERMTIEAARLGSLVQELIDLSRLQGAERLQDPQPTKIENCVAEAVDRLHLQADAKQIRLAVVHDGAVEPALTVFGVETQLTTAVANLIENAIAYSPEHTRVIVGMRRRDDVVEVSVADEGIGIAEVDQERVFERFYRADPARSRATGGTGLGLAIVKHIASNHGGEVVLWSADGRGSTFTLRLPAHQPDADTDSDINRQETP